MSEPVYAGAAEEYWGFGWRGVLPVPPGTKVLATAGISGNGGRFPSYPDVLTWQEDKPDWNIALRLPPGVIEIGRAHV